MNILKTFIMGAVLIGMGLPTPRSSLAQQREETRTEMTPRDVMAEFARRRARALAADESEDEGEANGGVNTQVVATSDERTNSVVVRGPAEVLDLISDVLTALDDTTTKVAGVKIFQLRYADAMNTAEVINQLFGEGQSSQSNQRGGMPFPGPMMFRGPGGRGGGQSNDQDSTPGQVVAAADSQTNTVVVTGPDNILEVVADVVTRLDAPIPNVADVKVFHLEYADAQDTAELINEVFGESSSSRTRSSRNQQSQQTRFMRGGFPGGTQQPTQGGGSSDVAVVAAADSLTNSVVVSGSADTLTIIADVIKELDENPEQERQIFVYPLKNAMAENLMEILNNLFDELQALNQQGVGTAGQQFQGGQRGAQPGGSAGGATSQASGGANDLDEETYFEADTDTNSLLVLTSTKNYERIRPILDELDKPVGQVLIKVLFAEVTHSNTVDLGTEFSMLNLRSGTGGSTTSTQVFGRPPSLFLPGESGEGGFTAPTGLSVRTIEGDLDFTIHALQESGRLNVLSRPYILTRNNQLATITVGEEVPIPTGSTTVAGQTQTTVEYRDDIGIVLDVTPSINREGLVNLVVSPRITTRTGDKVQVSEDLQAETFATRSADTRVAVEDGQTIVIGGLIEDQITDTVSKVPLLGDIPILGFLFKRTIQDKSKTELLIFLTPHVAAMGEDLTRISETERDRSNLNVDKEVADLFRQHLEAMKGPDADPNEAIKP